MVFIREGKGEYRVYWGERLQGPVALTHHPSLREEREEVPQVQDQPGLLHSEFQANLGYRDPVSKQCKKKKKYKLTKVKRYNQKRFFNKIFRNKIIK